MNSAWIPSLSLLAGAPPGGPSNAPNFNVLSSGSAARADAKTGAGWGCCECGAHTDAVFAVERGGLRRVYRTIANSN